MAREIQSRIIVKGRLQASTPLHVGGYGESVDTDLPLARDGKAHFYVPGTSIAGSLRSWFLDAFQESETQRLFGFQENDKGHASFVLVDDAVVLNVDNEPLQDYETEVRDGVGIDRRLGSSADRFKYDRAVLPRGARLDFQMALDIGVGVDLNRIQAMLGHMLQALSDGDIPFGAAKTRGLGRVFLKSPDIRIQHRNTRAGILSVLKGSNNSSSIANLKDSDPSLSPGKPVRLTVTIKWHPRSALMIKSGADGIGVDILPLVSGKDGDLALVLSGSSVKGALRSHAERIARTVLKKSLSGRERFDEQLNTIPLINDLFGMGKPAKSSKKDDARAGALAVLDCYAEQAMHRHQWDTVSTAKEESLQDVLEEIKAAGAGIFEQQTHVAIDRWTGAAADSMLFSVLEPYGIEWEPLVLKLDLDPYRHSKRAQDRQWSNKNAALALFLLTLRDLVAGRVALGFAVNRGMGEIAVDSIEFKLNNEVDSWLNKKVEFSQSDNLNLLSQLDGQFLGELSEAWLAWCQQNADKAPVD